MSDPDRGRARGRSFLTGSSLFLGLVLYVNLRHGIEKPAIDWAVIGLGGLAFAVALYRYLRK